jgi:glycosyltransferase involved in cell wall biosynthesis
MRIAQVAPLFESVPPRYYGGTERVVSFLTEALVDLGHDVTLFASGDSITRARLVPGCERALRLEGRSHLHQVPHILHLEQVFRRHRDFDIIHFHTDNMHFPLARRHPVPSITTLHGRLDLPDWVPLMQEFTDIPLVSISNAQRAPLAWARWEATVHHGLPAHLLPFSPGPGEYLAFLGRISPEKRCDRAIEIAKRLGLPLKIAAKVDPADQAYYEAQVKPLMNHPLVHYIGEINEAGKREFLGKAMALLFPIDWPEPFGLVMIEAMACGTPVVAFEGGSVAEIIEPGVTGCIVDSIDAAVAATRTALALDRRACRHRFEQRFSAERMARDYLDVYRRVALRRPSAPMHSLEVMNG